MKDFIETITTMYGVKSNYTYEQILSANNCFLRSQINKVNNYEKLQKKLEAIEKMGYFTVNQPSHKWHDRLVRSAKKANADGLCLIYYGSQTDNIHISKLI